MRGVVVIGPATTAPQSEAVGERGVVVIGYGSDLRRDDGAGRRVADAVAALALPGVTVRSVHQLAPEHAADVVGHRRAVFVDAAAPGGLVRVAVRTVTAVSPGWQLSHHLDPAALLALAATLGPAPDDAFLVTVPARDLGLGTELSAATAADVREAVADVTRLVTDRRWPPVAEEKARWTTSRSNLRRKEP